MVNWPEDARKLADYDRLRAENGELRAEVARLTAELDETQQRNVLNVRKSGIIDAMAISTGEPAGTVIRATDEPGLAFELGEDLQWRRLP